MTFDEYHKEIIKAKKEYDRSIKPILKKLEKVNKYVWKIYMKRIIQINGGDQ